jgi:hypothetical protein
MALSMDELFGSGNYAAVGALTGGSVKVLKPPAAVYDAGPLAIMRYYLDSLVAAQAADPAIPDPRPSVITRTSREISDGILQTTYTVTFLAPISALQTELATNVEDDFN